MHDTDCLHRFDFEQLPIRGLLIHLDASWRALVEHRTYPPAVRDALGQAVASSALLAATIKFDGQLTLQIKGDGPMPLLLAQCTDGLGVRGLARYQSEPATLEADTAIRQLVGEGTLTVTIESEDLAQRYQGIVPIEGERLAQCIETYFAQSEQLPTRLWLQADEQGVAGLLLQRLPAPRVLDDVAGEDEQRTLQRDAMLEDAWSRVQLIADTLKPQELRDLTDQEILRRLFNEDDLRLFDAAPVFFKCRCSRERVSAMLQALGAPEIESVLAEQGQVEVHCDFCNRGYVFDAVDVAQLFSEGLVTAGQRRH